MKIIAKRRTLKFGNTVCIQGEETNVSEIFRGIILNTFGDEVTFVDEQVKTEEVKTEEVKTENVEVEVEETKNEDDQLEEDNQNELETEKTEDVNLEEDLLQDLKKNIDTTKKAEIKEVLTKLDIEFDDELKTNELREFVKNLEA